MTDSSASEQNHGDQFYSRDKVIARLQAEQARVDAEQQARNAVIRDCEPKVLNAADALDPADVSKDAEYLRAVARAIRTEEDQEVRDRIIWGASASPRLLRRT